MTERVLGERGSAKRHRFLLLPILATTVLALFWITGAQAVHDLGLFELDRNATAGAAPGDDWSPNPPGATSFTGIIADNAGDGDQFQGGGSKDDLDIDQWLWKPGEPLDKDDITNGYAAAYVSTVDTGDTDIGDIILYYGLDRFSNNGSAQVGIWFFQNDIGKSNVASGGGFKFSGVHRNNDILVQSNFSGGGVISSVSVFRWLNGALVPVISAADCLDEDGNPSPGDDGACATANRVDTPAPWAYTPKAGTPGVFPQGSFFEGGLNVSRLVPDASCFTDIMVETRSSTPFDSRLKDFTLGSFQACEGSIVTTPSQSTIRLGQSITDSALITGSGTFAPPPKGQVAFFVCKVDSPGLCTTGGTALGVRSLSTNTLNPVTVTSDSFTPSQVGRYCFRAEWTLDPVYDDKSDSRETECFTVFDVTISTAQTFTIKDSATITQTGGGTLSGSVRFRLYPTADCSGATTLVDQTVAVSGASPQSVETTPLTITTDKPILSWLVEYTGSPGNVTSSCATENASLDINNG